MSPAVDIMITWQKRVDTIHEDSFVEDNQYRRSFDNQFESRRIVSSNLLYMIIMELQPVMLFYTLLFKVALYQTQL